MSAHDLAAWTLALRTTDRETLRVLAAMTHVLPWWGRDAAALVRAGPVAAFFLWTFLFFRLPPAAAAARRSQARALAGALLAAIGWAVAWQVFGLGPYAVGFAPAPAAQAVASALPLGAAMLALGAGVGGGATGLALRVVVVAYALARLAIGADGPLRVVAEAASAVAASLVVIRTPALCALVDGTAERVGGALGLRSRPLAVNRRR